MKKYRPYCYLVFATIVWFCLAGYLFLGVYEARQYVNETGFPRVYVDLTSILVGIIMGGFYVCFEIGYNASKRVNWYTDKFYE